MPTECFHLTHFSRTLRHCQDDSMGNLELLCFTAIFSNACSRGKVPNRRSLITVSGVDKRFPVIVLKSVRFDALLRYFIIRSFTYL
jgi:hypothetical protein